MSDTKCKQCGRWRGLSDYCQCGDPQQEKQIKSLISERDRLKAELQQMKIESQRLLSGFLETKVVEQIKILESQLAVARERIAKDKKYIENFLQPKLADAREALKDISAHPSVTGIYDYRSARAGEALTQLSDIAGKK